MPISTSIWEVATTLFTAVQTVSVVIALVYAAIQLKSTNKDRDLAIILKFYETFDNPEHRKNRYHIFNSLPKLGKDLSHPDYSIVRDTWNLMDQLGIIYHYNFASRHIILELFSLQTTRLWMALEPHILHYRKSRGRFAVYFERLAKDSIRYRKTVLKESHPVLYTAPRGDKVKTVLLRQSDQNLLADLLSRQDHTKISN